MSRRGAVHATVDLGVQVPAVGESTNGRTRLRYRRNPQWAMSYWTPTPTWPFPETAGSSTREEFRPPAYWLRRNWPSWNGARVPPPVSGIGFGSTDSDHRRNRSAPAFRPSRPDGFDGPADWFIRWALLIGPAGTCHPSNHRGSIADCFDCLDGDGSVSSLRSARRQPGRIWWPSGLCFGRWSALSSSSSGPIRLTGQRSRLRLRCRAARRPTPSDC